MDALTVHLEGTGFWSPRWADWNTAARALRGEAAAAGSAAKPAALALPPGERRRAPDLVLLACEIAAQACAAAGRAASDLPCVFVSAHGDLATADAICSTLASAPREVSPTRFHNSVHNAAAGYWTVATGCHAASTAIAAGSASLAAGLLEAALQTLDEGRPVLLAAYDVVAHNPLAETVRVRSTLGAAFVLNGEPGPHGRATLRLRHEAQSAAHADAHEASNASTVALPLLEALARGGPATLRLPSGVHGSLLVEVLA